MKQKRLVILLNIIAPQRIPILNHLSDNFDLTVLISGNEKNREYWSQYIRDNCSFNYRRVFGINISYITKSGHKKFKRKYVHLNPGYLFELMSLNPDFVISSEMGFRSIIALIYCSILRKPLWIWWGGILHTESRISYFKKYLRKVFLNYPRWISYGKSSTEYLISLGISNVKILEIQNTVDQNPFLEQEEELQMDLPKPIILFVGELIERKGLKLLLESVARLKSKGLKCSLIVIGDGPEKNTYQNAVKDLGLNNIFFHGSLNPIDIPKYYKLSNFMVFPSLHDVWGLVVNEALWSGLPVLSSIYAGASQDLLDEKFIFNPLNPSEFDEKMKYMFDNYHKPPDNKKLLKVEEVNHMILTEINKFIK